MYAARVLSPHIWHCSTCLQWDVECVFFFEEAESCEWELIETLWQNSEIK